VGPWPGRNSGPGARAERAPATAILDDAVARACAKAFAVPLLGTLGVVLRAKKTRPGDSGGRRTPGPPCRWSASGRPHHTTGPGTYRRELVNNLWERPDCRIAAAVAAKGGRTGLPHKTLAEALNVPNPLSNPPLTVDYLCAKNQAATQSGWTAASSGVLMLDDIRLHLMVTRLKTRTNSSARGGSPRGQSRGVIACGDRSSSRHPDVSGMLIRGKIVSSRTYVGE